MDGWRQTPVLSTLTQLASQPSNFIREKVKARVALDQRICEADVLVRALHQGSAALH